MKNPPIWNHRPAQARGPLGKAFGSRVRWRRLDWPVLFSAALLLGTGVLFVARMAAVDDLYGRVDVQLRGHLEKLAVTLPLLLIGVAIRPRWLRRNAWWIYWLAILGLLLVPIIGDERNSARRWLTLPGVPFDLQPSEFAKLALILVLARVLYRNRLARKRDWIQVAWISLLPALMVAKQPDLGTAMIIPPIALGMGYLAGGSGRLVGGLVAVGVVLGFLAWKMEWVQEYQVRRIDTWAASLDPDQLIADRNGDSFHVYHARVAIGNGGWRGTGLGRGIANQAAHLPERESDSIFAVIAEEGGFLGAGLLVFAYTLLVSMLIGTAARIRERYSRLVVGGVGLYFGAHFFVNVGVNLGLVPMTGLTLPLLSTGGSSMMATFLALGLALGLGANAEPSLDEDAFRA